MIISFHISEFGSVTHQYASDITCERLRDFRDKAPSHFTMTVKPCSDSFDAQMAKLAIAKHLWSKLGNVPTDDNGADGAIDEAFLHFNKGTSVYEIWDWFEEEFSVSVHDDLMFPKKTS